MKPLPLGIKTFSPAFCRRVIYLYILIFLLSNCGVAFIPFPKKIDTILGVEKKYAPLFILKRYENADIQIGESSDKSAIQVLSFTPGNGSSEVKIAESIKIIFSEPVESSSIDSSTLIVSTGINPVSGKIAIEEATVIFTPDNPLSYDTTYTISISKNIKDKKGNSLKENLNYTFSTTKVSDTTPPVIISVTPIAGSIGVDINQSIQITFSEPIDLIRLKSSTATITITDGTKNISYSLNSNGNVLQIIPIPSLSTLKIHTVNLNTDIKDLSGNNMLFKYMFSFQTNDLLPPNIVSSIPKSGAIRFLPGKPIQITFDEALDETTVNNNVIQLKQGATLLSGNISLSGNVVSFLPNPQLILNTGYTMTIASGIKDVSGNATTSSYAFSFTTYNPNIEIYMGSANTCFLIPPGKLRCVGFGSMGNLGYGDYEHKFGAASASDLYFGEGIMIVNANTNLMHTCATLSNGKGRCWGDNALGKLGYGSGINIINDTINTLDLPIIPKITSFSTATFYTCILLDTKKVRCWGSNYDGQLGYGNRDDIYNSELARDLNLGEDVVELKTNGQTCVRFASGNIRCWGANTVGQLAIGAFGSDTRMINAETTPNINLGAGLSAVKIETGGIHTCVLLSNKKVKCWGSPTHGYPSSYYDDPFGYILTVKSDPLNFSEDVIDLAAGNNHSCVALASGNIKCWGWGSQEGHGLGYGKGVFAPLASSAPAINFGVAATRVFAGATHTCALLANGAIKCWGSNSYGQLGYDSSIKDIFVATEAGDIYFDE